VIYGSKKKWKKLVVAMKGIQGVAVWGKIPSPNFPTYQIIYVGTQAIATSSKG